MRTGRPEVISAAKGSNGCSPSQKAPLCSEYGLDDGPESVVPPPSVGSPGNLPRCARRAPVFSGRSFSA
jgi:hypothetical protein